MWSGIQMLERVVALHRLLDVIARWRRHAATAVVAMLTTIVLATSASAAPDAAIVVDAKTGKVLYASNADAQRYPASLTKMMTLYMLFEAIESGKTSLDARIKVSAFAAGQPPSKLGVKAGNTIKVRDAILALVTRSANDIATAIAEYLAGSEKSFAQQMTTRARQLGMSKTTFRNAHGLPNSAQVTTARDLALLGRALQDHFPEYFEYFKTPSFVWQGRRIGSHNRLLGRVSGVNGIKTGYTRASGYNLVTSVDRGGRQIVAVVLGGETSKARDRWMVNLIDKYLPKASRGARTAPLVAGAAGLPAEGATGRVAGNAFPMPRLRPTTVVIAGAGAGVAPEPLKPQASPAPIAAAAPAPETRPATIETTASTNAAEPDGVFGEASVASLIGANSIFALDAETELQTVQQEGDAAVEDDDAEAPTPPAEIADGWKIQLAATPTQRSAQELLDKALTKAGKLLADASPYTEPVEAGNATLYRARFAGFADKESARAACAQLARHNFNCLAISN
jgi:D-alanyl-D-alanine carboxypeptidase